MSAHTRRGKREGPEGQHQLRKREREDSLFCVSRNAGAIYTSELKRRETAAPSRHACVHGAQVLLQVVLEEESPATLRALVGLEPRVDEGVLAHVAEAAEGLSAGLADVHAPGVPTDPTATSAPASGY